MTTITALPTPPSRDDPANFATRADAFLGALPDFVTETNTVAGEVNTNASTASTAASTATTQAGNASTSASTASTKAGEASASAAAALASENAAANYAAALKGTSTTSLAIGTGSKAFTTQSGKQWSAGQFVVAVDSANNANYMHGQVTSYAATSLVLDVQSTGGNGTIASWNIYVAGNRGAQGAAGTGDLTGPSSSVDSEIALFDSTTGKVLKRATTTGILKASSGVLSAATAGTDYGYINVPKSGSAKTTSYSLATTDIGEFIEVGSGGSITIPDATFAAGDVVSIFNNTSAGITITCSITTAYIAGTDSDKATVTLATRGLATILFISGTVCVITGNVS